MSKNPSQECKASKSERISLPTIIFGALAISVSFYLILQIIIPIIISYNHPLKNAIIAGNIEAIKKAIENGVDVNAKNALTPLTLTFRYGRYNQKQIQSDFLRYSKIRKMVEILIDNGADVNMTDKSGNIPLLAAMTNGFWYYPPEKATIQEYKEIIKILINNGADVNVKPEAGNTPLHWAVFDSRSFNNSDIIELLLKYGARVNVENDEGETALDLAKEQDDKELVQLLLNYVTESR